MEYCLRVEEEQQPTIDFETKEQTWKEVSEVVKKARTYKVYKASQRCSWKLFQTLENRDHSWKLAESRRVICTKGKKRYTVYNNLTDERREDYLLLCIVKQDDKVYDREW